MREHKGRKIELVEQQGGESNNSDDMEPKIIRAAEYVRMSTEHQQYSTENQGDAIRGYAERHHMEIVRTYSDAGKSGLKIEGLYIRQGGINATQGFLLHEPNLTDLMDRYFNPTGAAWWSRDPSEPPAARTAPDRKV